MRYVVLLRGVNIGGRIIKMAALKACLEQYGFHKVVTVLQSGNVLLDTDEADITKVQAEIETILSHTFHYPAQAIVLSPDSLTAIMGSFPLPEGSDTMHRYVIFLKEKPDTLTAGIVPDSAVEAIVPGGAVVYWRVLKGRTLDSSFAKQLAKYSTRHFATNRNIHTLQKILAKV